MRKTRHFSSPPLASHEISNKIKMEMEEQTTRQRI
jgi:hypothetical protein